METLRALAEIDALEEAAADDQAASGGGGT